MGSSAEQKSVWSTASDAPLSGWTPGASVAPGAPRPARAADRRNHSRTIGQGGT